MESIPCACTDKKEIMKQAGVWRLSVNVSIHVRTEATTVTHLMFLDRKLTCLKATQNFGSGSFIRISVFVIILRCFCYLKNRVGYSVMALIAMFRARKTSEAETCLTILLLYSIVLYS